MVLNTGPLEWESSVLTTRPLLHPYHWCSRSLIYKVLGLISSSNCVSLVVKFVLLSIVLAFQCYCMNDAAFIAVFISFSSWLHLSSFGITQHKKWTFLLRISSINMKKSLMENFILCAVQSNMTPFRSGSLCGIPKRDTETSKQTLPLFFTGQAYIVQLAGCFRFFGTLIKSFNICWCNTKYYVHFVNKNQ